jgi:HD-GYP domain-containing protein (c-di-GMP phosphodiesterase class II)
MGYKTVLIQVPGTESVTPENVISEKAQAEMNTVMEESSGNLQDIVSRIRPEHVNDMHRILFQNRRDLNRFIMSSTIARQLETIIEQILNQPQIVLNMAALRTTAETFFERAVNVTITALCIGKKHRFSYEEIKQLATGALNYHIGMVALPKELLSKTDSLTIEERQLYRQHTVYGYLLLAQNPIIPPTSAIVALQHHEYQNGEGYPLRLKGSNCMPVKDITRSHVIHRFAEIVAVADAYHTLQQEHGGDPTAIQTQEIIKKLIHLGGDFLNCEIVKTLVSVVPAYPVGARIRIVEAPSALLKRYVGVVARDNPENLARPVIVLYETVKKEPIDPPIIINTAQNDSITFELIA